jgi:hypothetical protein
MKDILMMFRVNDGILAVDVMDEIDWRKDCVTGVPNAITWMNCGRWVNKNLSSRHSIVGTFHRK